MVGLGCGRWDCLPKQACLPKQQYLPKCVAITVRLRASVPNWSGLPAKAACRGGVCPR